MRFPTTSFCKPLPSEIEALPKMLPAIVEGRDLAIGDAKGVMDQKGAGRALTFWMFRTIYRLMSAATYWPIPFAFRPFERATALHIASRNNGGVLIRARSLGQGFFVAIIDVPVGSEMTVRGLTAKKSVSKPMRLILTGNALLLRTTSYLGMDSGICSPIAGV